jgi:hypothetical protein
VTGACIRRRPFSGRANVTVAWPRNAGQPTFGNGYGSALVTATVTDCEVSLTCAIAAVSKQFPTHVRRSESLSRLGCRASFHARLTH